MFRSSPVFVFVTCTSPRWSLCPAVWGEESQCDASQCQELSSRSIVRGLPTNEGLPFFRIQEAIWPLYFEMVDVVKQVDSAYFTTSSLRGNYEHPATSLSSSWPSSPLSSAASFRSIH